MDSLDSRVVVPNRRLVGFSESRQLSSQCIGSSHRTVATLDSIPPDIEGQPVEFGDQSLIKVPAKLSAIVPIAVMTSARLSPCVGIMTCA